MSKKSKSSYTFDSFFRELMNNITGPITLFVFPAFIIFNFFSLVNLDPSIQLSIGKWFGLISATYTTYFAYGFFVITIIFAFLSLDDSTKDISRLKETHSKITAWFLIALLALGFVGSFIWTISVFEAQGRNIQILKNTQ